MAVCKQEAIKFTCEKCGSDQLIEDTLPPAIEDGRAVNAAFIDCTCGHKNRVVEELSFEDKTLNVRQRTYQIVKKSDRKSILRTGYIGPCVAFYGVNKQYGVAFLSHVDGNVIGLGDMVEKLKSETNGDFAGFSLYLTTNYTFKARLILTTILICLSTVLQSHSSGKWLEYVLLWAFPSVVIYFGFSSYFQILYLAIHKFKTWRISHMNPKQYWGRVEVIIDSVSDTGPSKWGKDPLPDKVSKERYGPTDCYFSKRKPVTRDDE